MGISIGGRKDKAYMAVGLKVIDTETGEIVDSRTVETSDECMENYAAKDSKRKEKTKKAIKHE